MQIFRLIIKKQHYYLLIYRKTIMFARKIPPLQRSNGILSNKTSMRKGFKMRDYSLFIFLNL